MKIILNFLIFGFVLNFTSAFLWFGSEDVEQAKPIISTSTSQHPTAVVEQQNSINHTAGFFHQPIQGLTRNFTNHSLSQRIQNRSQNQVQNLTNIQHQGDTLKKNNNTANIPFNRFHALIYRQQQQKKQPPRNNQSFVLQQNHPNSNRIFNPRYRSFQRNKTIIGSSFNRPMAPSAVRSNSHLADSKVNSSLKTNNKTQTIQSQTIVNTNNRQNRQRLLDNYNYHEQMRDYYGRLYQNSIRNNQVNVQETLRRHKREDEPEKNNQPDSLSMIFSRLAPANDETEH